jgi:hypothetical protein
MVRELGMKGYNQYLRERNSVGGSVETGLNGIM